MSSIRFLSGFIFIILASLPYQSRLFAQISVSPDQTPIALAEKLAGRGVTVFNATLTCAAQANGFFTVTSSNLGLDAGIVLTNGRAATAGSLYGVNGPSSYFASTDNGMPGDAALNSLAGRTTFDACSLEFDVIPIGDTIKFNYVFSSEEYKNAVCGPYNDAFGFFISGPGIPTYENMALVPGTNIPVTINTINNGIPGSTGTLSNCTGAGPGSPFTSYYIDNTAGTTLTHYGLTTVLQAIHGVIPCKTYHLKLSIADADDPLYDSGVFLQAGSLQTDNYSITAATTVIRDTPSAICVKGCLPGRFIIQRTQAGTKAQTIRYIIAGSAVNGVDYSAIADSVVIPAYGTSAAVEVDGLPTPAAGAKTVQLYILSPFTCAGGNNIADSAQLTIYDTLHISIQTPDAAVCSNDSVHILVNGPDFTSYSWSPSSGLSDPSAKNPVAVLSASSAYAVNAYLPGTSCVSNAATINFTLKLTPIVSLIADTTICFNSQLSVTPALVATNPYDSYKWTGPDNFTSSQATASIRHATPAMQGMYKLTVTNDTNGCKAITPMNVTVTTPDTPGVENPVVKCVNTTASPIGATGSNLLWYNNVTDSAGTAEAPTPPTNIIATFVYYVTQTVGGCESPKKKVNVDVLRCCDGHIGLPNAFTPNNDGRNDKFEVYSDYGYTVERLSVFNRWGELVYSDSEGKWDGTYKGAPAETGTYYYNITLKCILGNTVELKGDVTLIK